MKKTEEKICPVCGRVIPYNKYVIRRFCSFKCYHRYRKLHHKRKPEKTTKICLWCQQPFKTYMLKRQKYCCSTCATTYRYAEKQILKTIEFNNELRIECLNIFSENGLKSTFPIPELNTMLKQTRKDYEWKLKQYGEVN